MKTKIKEIKNVMIETLSEKELNRLNKVKSRRWRWLKRNWFNRLTTDVENNRVKRGE